MSKYHTTKSSSGSSGGVGVLGVLQIIFIVLKIVDVIDWSWWSVFIPTFIGLGWVALILLATFVVFLIMSIKEKKNKR